MSLRYLIVAPYVHAPSFSRCCSTMAPEVRERVMGIDNSVENLGAAASYNIGAARVLDEELDWLVTCSPATRFGPTGSRDFVASLSAYPDAWVIESAMPVGWHFIAWHRRVFERVGLWDENFWPVYGEDADIAHRIAVAMSEDDRSDAWRRQPIDAWLTMQGHSARLGGVVEDQQQIWRYYRAKWGGLSGHEEWVRPFGEKPLDYWEPRR